MLYFPFAALHIARAIMIIGAAENKPTMKPIQNIIHRLFTLAITLSPYGLVDSWLRLDGDLCVRAAVSR